ncbi:MAG: hypothetical protein AAFU64_12090, partial [Bacteroidota bacterium]
MGKAKILNGRDKVSVVLLVFFLIHFGTFVALWMVVTQDVLFSMAWWVQMPFILTLCVVSAAVSMVPIWLLSHLLVGLFPTKNWASALLIVINVEVAL